MSVTTTKPLEPSTSKFSLRQRAFFASIRDDIASRPDFYRAGFEYVEHYYSVDAVHEVELRTWKELQKINPSEAKPNAKKDSLYWLSSRLIRAFTDLLRVGLSPPNDSLDAYDLDKAKAVLCVTWLLTDVKADEHPLGRPYGGWKSVRGRDLARDVTLLLEYEEGSRGRWMKLAREAAVAVSLGQEKRDRRNGKGQSVTSNGEGIGRRAAATSGEKIPIRRAAKITHLDPKTIRTLCKDYDLPMLLWEKKANAKAILISDLQRAIEEKTGAKWTKAGQLLNEYQEKRENVPAKLRR